MPPDQRDPVLDPAQSISGPSPAGGRSRSPAFPGRSQRAAPGTFLARLEPDEREALHDLGIVRSFPSGAVLMIEGEPGDRIMILIEGRVKVTRTDEQGRQALVSIRDPGDVLGELASIDRRPRVATVSALDPITVLALDSRRFRHHLETTPRVAVVLLEVVSDRLREATQKRVEFSSLDTMGRVCARLLELGERYGESLQDGSIAFTSPLSNYELVGWVGASRTGVAQALQELRELGWITTQRRQVTLRQLDVLRRRAA